MNLATILILCIFLLIVIMAYVGYTLFQVWRRNNASGITWEAGYASGNVKQVDEYSRLLEFFKLTDAASEEEIKEAYRKYVRENHPDMNNSDPEKIKKFQEVKSIYERIMDIKRNSFMNRGASM